MSVLNILCFSDESFARELGKKTDDRDVESYIYKEQRGDIQDALTFLRPRKHPEKMRPLLGSLDIADAAIIEIKKVDASIGEVLVASSVAGIERGLVVINPEEGGWVDPDQVKTILDQAGLKSWKINEQFDPHQVKEIAWSFLDDLDEVRSQRSAKTSCVPVDQHFNVKGVGLVAIGTVQSGSIKKHDNVIVTPGGYSGVIRSLQVMDVDVDIANSGDRVGVAIRNMKEGALERGVLISISGDEEMFETHNSSSLTFIRAPFQKRNIEVGMVIHASTDLQFVVGRVKSFDIDQIFIEWDSPITIRKNSDRRVVLSQLDSAPMRILGNATNMKKE
tara:strand:- start:7687 stop:8688 length:1002 start_codon:yes stop_codon:yes gene_type:complete